MFVGRAEYKALLDRRRPAQDDLRLARVALDAYAPWLRSFVEDIVLVEKLAETRALTGFSRIDPDLATDAWVPRLPQLSMDPKQKWLSAIRVYGEGIFLTLSQDRLTGWVSSFGSRASELAQRHSDVSRRRGRPSTPVPPSFLVLHTLAHILIRRVSFECGYGSASIRERIYCREPGSKPGMAGVLIYTAAGDSDGTMGGLVQQGRPGRLEALVRGAVEEARWCSSDHRLASCRLRWGSLREKTSDWTAWPSRSLSTATYSAGSNSQREEDEDFRVPSRWHTPRSEESAARSRPSILAIQLKVAENSSEAAIAVIRASAVGSLTLAT